MWIFALLVVLWVGTWVAFCKDKGYINVGTDPRIFGRLGGELQSLFSWPFAWLGAAPLSFRFGNHAVCFPPFVALNFAAGNGKWNTFRAGWRYDVNAKRYIGDVIIKLGEPTPLYWLLLLCLLPLMGACGAHKVPPPTTIRVVETQEVKVAVPVRVAPPAELLAPIAPPLPVFVAPTDPDASSALTEEGERFLRALIQELLSRIAAWQTWAQEAPAP